MLDLTSLGASMLFPLLGMMVFSTLGLALSMGANKKGAAVAIAVVVYFALTMVSMAAIGFGSAAAMRDHPTSTMANYTEFLPLEYKLLIYGNPVILAEGTNYILGTGNDYTDQLFDTGGGVALAAIFLGIYLALGLTIYYRERMDRSWVSSIRKRWHKET
jgi:uncharacterized protein (DUF2062 family)